jgi:hypothetical protein
MCVPKERSEDFVFVFTVTGFIMLFCAVAGFFGFPMKGNADPRDVASGVAGLISAASILFLFS